METTLVSSGTQTEKKDISNLKRKRPRKKRKTLIKKAEESKDVATVAETSVTNTCTVKPPVKMKNRRRRKSSKNKQTDEKVFVTTDHSCTLNGTFVTEELLNGNVEKDDIPILAKIEDHTTERKEGISLKNNNGISNLAKIEDHTTERKEGISLKNNNGQVVKEVETRNKKKTGRRRKKSVQGISTTKQASPSASEMLPAKVDLLDTHKPQENSKKRKRRNKKSQANAANDEKQICTSDRLHAGTNIKESGEKHSPKKMKLSPEEEDLGIKNQDLNSTTTVKKKRRRQKKKKPVKTNDKQTNNGMTDTLEFPFTSQPAREKEPSAKSGRAAGSSGQNPSKKRRRSKSRKGKAQKHLESAKERTGKLNQNNVTQPIPGDDDKTQSKKKMKNDKDRSVTKKSNSLSTGTPNLSVAHMKRKDSIKESWGGDNQCGQLWQDTRVEVIKDPFSCCYIPSFLSDSTYLSCVKEELAELEMITKNNDLYKFHQTIDLRNVTSPCIAGLRHFLYGEFREWLRQVTGIPLSDKVDMGCSKYEYTDVLLCHDDELEGRRIAYILYLVPPWSQEDGGTLDLFTTDEHGHPSNIVRSLVPEWNAFAFFEVSPVSFHQVSEVLSRDKVRLSINGWFHGPAIEHPERHLIPPTSFLPGHIEEEDVYAWVNHIYLDQATQQQIKRKFRTESAIELDNFVTEDKYEELSKALKEGGLSWENVGPANKQSIHTLNIDKAPEVVKSCAELLKSEAMFLILSQLTGLKLHKLAPPDSEPDSDDENEAEPNPCMTLSVHQWGHGSYTLVRDDCVETSSALDAHLFLNVAESWSQELGGYVSYIAKNEDEELLTVLPRTNCLALVYRDTETLKFTKHINASVAELGEADSTYHTFSSVYYE